MTNAEQQLAFKKTIKLSGVQIWAIEKMQANPYCSVSQATLRICGAKNMDVTLGYLKRGTFNALKKLNILIPNTQFGWITWYSINPKLKLLRQLETK